MIHLSGFKYFTFELMQSVVQNWSFSRHYFAALGGYDRDLSVDISMKESQGLEKQAVKHSISIKALIIGGLVILLMVPVLLVEDMIHQRQQMQWQAKAEISHRWGGEQFIGAPQLLISHLHQGPVDGKNRVSRVHSRVLPREVDAAIDLQAEVRYLGIYEVPVYSAEVDLQGRFEFEPADFIQAQQPWQVEGLFVPLQSLRGLKEIARVEVNGQPVPMHIRQRQFSRLNGVFIDLQDTAPQTALTFDLKFHISGSESLKFLPHAGTARVDMRSNWPSPSFIGDYLPEQRAITEKGFSAQWRVNELNHGLGRVLSTAEGGDVAMASMHWPELGVQTLIPADVYQVNTRMIKYAMLVMLFSFAGFFLAELFFRVRLHPFQYLLIGFALCVFYVLLLSLSEYLRFNWAYAISAAATVALISGYSGTLLRSGRRGVLTGVLFSVLYAFVFVMVKAEQLSLLMGALALWALLGIIMYLTRRVDWYAGVTRAERDADASQ